MEIEVKVKVKDLEELKSRLENDGIVFEDAREQRDIIFKPKGEEYTKQKPGSWIVRLRKNGGIVELGYKELTETPGVWVEHETEVVSFDEALAILEKTGFSKTIEMNKVRRIGKTGNITICLDDIEKLGTFMELEIIGEDHTKKELIEFMSKYGFKEDEIIHKGYVRMLFEMQGVEFS